VSSAGSSSTARPLADARRSGLRATWALSRASAPARAEMRRYFDDASTFMINNRTNVEDRT